MMTEPEIQEFLCSVGIDDSDPKRREAVELLCTFGFEDYEEKRAQLREAFKKMQFLNKESPLRIWLESLLRKSKLYAESSIREYPRQHNTFVQYYVMNTSARKISRYQMINVRTVFKDLELVLGHMMIFAYGIDGIWQGKRRNKISKAIPSISAKERRATCIERFVQNNKLEIDCLAEKAKEYMQDVSGLPHDKQCLKLRKQLKILFSRYIFLNSDGPLKSWMDQILTIHSHFIDACQDEKLSEYRKLFDRRYLKGQSVNGIAQKIQISIYTCYRVIDQVIDEIIYILYGLKRYKKLSHSSVTEDKYDHICESKMDKKNSR